MGVIIRVRVSTIKTKRKKLQQKIQKQNNNNSNSLHSQTRTRALTRTPPRVRAHTQMYKFAGNLAATMLRDALEFPVSSCPEDPCSCLLYPCSLLSVSPVFLPARYLLSGRRSWEEQVQPDTSPVLPNATSVQPDARPVEPDTNPVQPDTELVKPHPNIYVACAARCEPCATKH